MVFIRQRSENSKNRDEKVEIKFVFFPCKNESELS